MKSKPEFREELRTKWRERAAEDPDWAANQLLISWDHDIAMRAELADLRAGVIASSDTALDRLQRAMADGVRVELNLGLHPQPNGEPYYEVRLYQYPRTGGWLTASGVDLRQALQFAADELDRQALQRDAERYLQKDEGT